MIRRPPRSTQSRSSAASDVYKRQCLEDTPGFFLVNFGDKCYSRNIGRFPGQRGDVVPRYVSQRELARSAHQLPHPLSQPLVICVDADGARVQPLKLLTVLVLKICTRYKNLFKCCPVPFDINGQVTAKHAVAYCLSHHRGGKRTPRHAYRFNVRSPERQPLEHLVLEDETSGKSYVRHEVAILCQIIDVLEGELSLIHISEPTRLG